MNTLWKSTLKAVLAVGVTGLLAVAQAAVARPGMLNYVEGNVTLDGKTLDSSAMGNQELSPGHILRTQTGKAEMLLTPGVFLRLGDNSAVELQSASLTNTQVALREGEALVEVDQIAKENHIGVTANGVPTTLEKKGIYDFNATQPSLRVYDGQASVQLNDRDIKVKKGHELPLVETAVNVKPQKFDRDQTDPLYAWSKLRSGYIAEASQASAQTIIVNNPGWYGSGWYWNPWYSTWAFLPGDGYFYSPFGYPFYAPSYLYYGGFYPRYYRTSPRIVGGVHQGFTGGGVRGGFNGGGFRGGVTAPAARPAAPALGGSGVHFGGIGRR